MEGLLKCDQSWKRVILNNQATIGHYFVAYLIQGVWKGGPASANTPSKNKQKAGGGTEQKKSGTPLKLLLIVSIDTILKAVDKRKLTGVIYVDMSKAFDSINHSIL